MHTSDWHLGQEFYSYNRIEEHESFLHQLETIVSEERPDVMVVCGDIYHNAVPSNAVMRLFTDSLDRIRLACPEMQIVVTAGNHDSSSRLEVSRALWQHLNVYVVGCIEKQNGEVNFSRHVIPVYNKEKKKAGYVVAMPHVFPQNYPLLSEEASHETRQSLFFKALAEYVESVNTEHLPIVMMAHMAVAGSDTSWREDSRGGIDFTDVADLHVKYDYLALGHIHYPQNIGGNHVRYCGSPIPVSFDESYPHSVSVINIAEAGAVPEIHTIPIINPWPLITMPQEAVSFEESITLLEAFPPQEKAYIRLRVKLKDVAPGNALERADAAVKEKVCRFCCFKWEREQAENEVSRIDFGMEQIQQISPIEVARHYYHDTYGEIMGKDLEAMLQEVMNRIVVRRKEL